jgi:4-amino-4-deoxy-L-arabinose transferase-like glycosyltransferase
MSIPDRVPEESVRRSRHLLDPADLAQSHRRSQGTTESLGSVQRWVMSVLAVTTILHLAAGLVLAAVFMEDSRQGARIGLSVIAGGVGVLAVAIARVIHRRPPLSTWLLLGLVPAVVGLVLVLR